MDPELGCSVVDLGLIYSVEIEARKILIKMTLTTRGCPMQDRLARGVRIAALRLEPVQEVDVQVVWEPPWNPSMMSEAARERLGAFGISPCGS
jgi:metal-sulfur cluster biosynthetic enzyme